MIKKCGYIFGMCILVSCVVSSDLCAEFKPFEGDSADLKEVLSYVSKYSDMYAPDLSIIFSPSERRDRNRYQQELHRLVLKIDVGDVRDQKLRKKLVAMRRVALRNQSEKKCILNNFDSSRHNRRGIEMGFDFLGVSRDISPWATIAYENEDHRVGKKVIRIDYDLSAGSFSFYHMINDVVTYKEYGALSFRVKGDLSAFTVAMMLRDGNVFAREVQGISQTWQTINLPFHEFSKEVNFSADDIRRITMTFEDRFTCDNAVGSVYFDDLMFVPTTVKNERMMKKQRGFSYEVEGAVPLGTNKSFFRHDVRKDSSRGNI